MCEINVVIKRNCINEKDKSYLEMATALSYADNNDGDGYFSIDERGNVTMKKSKEKLFYNGINKNNKSVISHQRLATSGKGIDNIHPYETEHFVMVHNGVFQGKGNKEKSDSREYLEKIEEKYKVWKDLEDIIKEVNESNNFNGSYSIFIYSKEEKQLYYFKNERTSMYSLETEERLLMSTEKRNLQVAKELFDIKEEIKAVTSNKIYEVNNTLEEIKEFEGNSKRYTYRESSGMGAYRKVYNKEEMGKWRALN